MVNMNVPTLPFARADAFCVSNDLRVPILLAPMAGACPPSLSIAVINAGGLGACGALLMQPPAIRAWADEVRANSGDQFQINLWIPDPPPGRDPAGELAVRDFLEAWGPDVPATAGDASPPDFDAQCDAIIEIRPRIMSSIMGLYPPHLVDRMKSAGIRWFANATTVTEAIAAEEAGADAVVAQGMEAGGHRGTFAAAEAERTMIGLFSLLPAIVDAVRIPVVATGGIADERAVAAAMLLGATAVQIGTGFLRCPEARLPGAWADAIGTTLPEQTIVTRAFSGRAGRSIATRYATVAAAPDAPKPAPYPVQRGLTQAMRDRGTSTNDIDRIQAWAGQSAARARPIPAHQIVTHIWDSACSLLT